MSRLTPWWPLVWSTVLALVLLGPALGPGFVLRYDMVFVPDLDLRPDFLGVASSLPRAVPSDAVVAVADLFLPGMLLQKAVLLCSLVAAGTGAARLLPVDCSGGSRLVAATFAIWNPFVVERLLIGHWPVLVGYAALPWVVWAARRWRASGRLPAVLPLLVVLGSLSAGAGVVTGVTLLALTAGTARRTLTALGVLVAANSPWLVSGALHAGSATADPGGATAFALGDAGSLPGPVAALGLGGIWNLEVVPTSQSGLLGWGFVIALAGLAALGARSWWRRSDRREAVGLLGCWLLGYGLAVLTWWSDDAVGWVGDVVPGGGLLRDGARFLALCAPLTVLLAAHGADTALRAVRGHPVPRLTLAGVLAVLPVTLMPDAVAGVAGRLHAVDYPAAYAEARAVMLTEQGPGDVVLLPLTAYRQPAWNDGTKVLDPAGRYLPRDYVASDELVVSGRPIAGEDPAVRAVATILDAATPEERAAGLAAEGIGYAVVTGPGAPEVTGSVLVESPDLTVIRLDDPRELEVRTSWVLAMTLAWTAYASVTLLGGLLALLRPRGPGRRRQVPAR